MPWEYKRAAFVRYQLQQQGMPVDDAPEDEDVRQTYNFAPGYHGLVYRADVPYYGTGYRPTDGDENATDHDAAGTLEDPKETKYKLQAMKWGLVPFWTKRNPDYGTVLKTINARDDSLMENRGMWNTMKKSKRCIVIAQGFYEWLKKNNGKEKIPHFVKRKDGQLMCFAGLWDCVQYEGSPEKLFTYTIITTDSNKQLKFLHDRMPVILENGSDQIRTWLDPKRSEWTKELQSLLKPFNGELECYSVSKDVGKVGNNSPDFIVPVASSENKNNIANFFGNAKKGALKKEDSKEIKEEDEAVVENEAQHIKSENEDDRVTIDKERTEDNAPMPVPSSETKAKGIKRKADDDDADSESPLRKSVKSSQEQKSPSMSPVKSAGQKTRSAVKNNTTPKTSPTKASSKSQKITAFFNK